MRTPPHAAPDVRHLLTAAEMTEADRLAIAAGPHDGMALMRRAGAAVAALALERWPGTRAIMVICGPGNNGGDGYVVARLLREAGAAVSLYRADPPRPGSDAALAAAECPVEPRGLDSFRPDGACLVIDALFGAGLSKPLGGIHADAIDRVAKSGAAVLAVDLPSGISGDSGAVLGCAPRAEATVTFFRRKPGHVLFPGRDYCGETIVADIGIPACVLDDIAPRCVENAPALWRTAFPQPEAATYKYARGHVGVFSGAASATGAARLSAMGAARAGAGAVTMLSPAGALQVNAMHLTATILRRVDTLEEAEEFLRDRKPAALVLGPGLGTTSKAAGFAHELIARSAGLVRHIVFDADALTVFAHDAGAFFRAARLPAAPQLLLTPHEGEFRRLFPDLADDRTLSKLDRARAAAKRANAVVILKGPDTVIATPDGRAAINGNGTPLLATAGSGDVLAGIAAGLLAQGMPGFEAAAAAVWLHAEAAARFGPGLIAEDLPDALLPVLRQLAGS